MPTANYDVYVSDAGLIALIEEYCEDNDLSESEAFREAMRHRLATEGYA